MLTLKLLRENPEFVIEKLAKKNFDAKEIVAKINDLDQNRRALQAELDSCLAEQKKNSSMEENDTLASQPKWLTL